MTGGCWRLIFQDFKLWCYSSCCDENLARSKQKVRNGLSKVQKVDRNVPSNRPNSCLYVFHRKVFPQVAQLRQHLSRRKRTPQRLQRMSSNTWKKQHLQDFRIQNIKNRQIFPRFPRSFPSFSGKPQPSSLQNRPPLRPVSLAPRPFPHLHHEALPSETRWHRHGQHCVEGLSRLRLQEDSKKSSFKGRLVLVCFLWSWDIFGFVQLHATTDASSLSSDIKLCWCAKVSRSKTGYIHLQKDISIFTSVLDAYINIRFRLPKGRLQDIWIHFGMWSQGQTHLVRSCSGKKRPASHGYFRRF